MKKILLALCLLLFPTLALSQNSPRNPCYSTAGVGCQPVGTTTPLPMAIYNSGSTATVSLDGALSVNTPAQAQFADTFSAALDTTTNWTAKNSTGTAATSAGQLVINSSTTASAWGGVTSQQSFAPVGVSPQVFGVLASFPVTSQANSTRVFGMFTVPGTPTIAVPVTDGYIFRLSGVGQLFAEVWSAGVAVSSTDVTATCLPAANFPGIFAINYRANLVQFTCGSALVTNLPPVLGINPVNQILPVSALSIAGSTPPVASAVINLSAIALAALSPGTVKSAAQAPTLNDPYIVVGISPNSQSTYPATYSALTTAIAGNASGSTGAVVGTLAAATAKLTYICGFNVQAIGGTAPVGPITVAGLIGSSQTYQGSASAAGGVIASQTFTPCIPSSAVNTAITITTTANGTATAVNVNSWGYQQ